MRTSLPLSPHPPHALMGAVAIIIFLAGSRVTTGPWVGGAAYASEKAGSNLFLDPAYTKMPAAPASQCRAGQQDIPRPCGSLAGIAAISGSDLWAVGTNFNTGASPLPAPLIEQWDGKIWQIMTPPKSAGDLAAVAAVSATNIWAVGRMSGRNAPHALILHYDGQRWSVVPNPATAGFSFLSAVAARSSDDVWTAGMETNPHGESQAVVEHWDGARWRQAAIPAIPNSELYGLAVISPHDVWAVGAHELNPLLLHWNGIVWRTVAFPPGHYPTGQASPQSMVTSQLTAVTAITPDTVWAVGSYDASDCCRAGSGPIAAQWNGTQWQQMKVPNIPNSVIADSQGVNLTAISAVSATDIWAVSSSDVAHWDGKQWKITGNPRDTPSMIVALSGVAAISKQNVWAVGYNGTYETAIAHWNGTRWSIVPSPNTNQ